MSLGMGKFAGGFWILGVLAIAACSSGSVSVNDGESDDGPADAQDAGNDGGLDDGDVVGADDGEDAGGDEGGDEGQFPAPRPEFCMEGNVDKCQEALDIWDQRMRNDSGRDYCTAQGESMGWVEGHILNAFAYGYLATRDTVYLDKLVQHIDGAICRSNECDPCLFTRETYDANLAPEWGWYEVSDWYSEDGVTRFDFMVGEGIMLQAVVLFIEAVRSDPALSADYRDDADYYLALLEDELVPKWDRRDLFKDENASAGVYIFQDHPGHLRQSMSLPHNQLYEFAQAILGLWRVTGDTWYRDRAGAVFNHWVTNKFDDSGVVNWNYWDPAGAWDYDINGDPLHWVGEEHTCGYKGITSAALVETGRHCLVVTEQDIQGVMERHAIYSAANSCSPPPVFGYFDEAALEAAFEAVRADPTSWGNLTGTPLLLWVMDSRERYKYYSTCP
ncbi:hypothetical protein ACFL2F_01260 [Myxococcota bacterium]